MISGKNVSWRYKNKNGASALKEVSFELEKGRIISFMGQSGGGKTTLLKCIANLYEYEGLITYNGKDLKDLDPVQRASTIGFVLQQFHLFPHLTALKNCTFALREVAGMKEKEAEKKASEVLDLLGMFSFAEMFPSQLSGGQQQRVAIARALVLNPSILLLDEPTSALDPESKKSLENLLLNLNAKNMTIILSSHDMPFIRKMADYAYFMEEGELVEKWDQKNEDLQMKKKIGRFLLQE